MMNLAINARDAMPLGGRLSIRTSTNQQLVTLRVADSGTGMPPHVLERIFEPFYTTKEMGKGTGLGLSTVYGIITQSGGDIQVTSDLGVGTTFTISLPAAPATEEPSAEPEEPPSGNETVLLVEDEKPVRELVAQLLDRLGYTVLVAAAAPKRCGSHSPTATGSTCCSPTSSCRTSPDRRSIHGSRPSCRVCPCSTSPATPAIQCSGEGCRKKAWRSCRSRSHRWRSPAACARCWTRPAEHGAPADRSAILAPRPDAHSGPGRDSEPLAVPAA